MAPDSSLLKRGRKKGTKKSVMGAYKDYLFTSFLLHYATIYTNNPVQKEPTANGWTGFGNNNKILYLYK